MGILVHLEKINKSYLDGKKRRDVLLDLDLTINDGEFVAISGRSGSGKTTVLSIIGMFTTAISGNFKFQEIDVSRISESQRNELRLNNIGFVFQEFNLFNDLTVEENVQLPLTGLGIRRKEIKQRSLEVLREVSMEDRRKSSPNKLSGGEQQRVGVARAIVTNPILLLADEPTGNLDQENEKIILNLLRHLNEKKKCAICLVSHDVNCLEIADRCFTLQNGKLSQVLPKS